MFRNALRKRLLAARALWPARVRVTGKRLFAIVGLARSGTSVLAVLLNSTRNSFCLSEPYVYQQEHGKRVPEDLQRHDLHLLQMTPLDRLPEAAHSFLQDSKQYALGGIKEIIEPGKTRHRYLLRSAAIDFFILVLREPRSCYASWKREWWLANSAEQYCATFLGMVEELRVAASRSPVFVLSYEDFTGGRPFRYLTNTLREVGLSFRGLPILNPKQYHSGVVDARANDSLFVAPARVEFDELLPDELDLIYRLVMPVYASLPAGQRLAPSSSDY